MRKKTVLRIGLIVAFVLPAMLALAYTRWFVAAQAAGIEYGETVSGNISGPDDQDTWTFDGQAGDLVRVEVTRTEGNLVPVVALVGPDNALLVSLEWPEDGPPVALLTSSLRISGAHQIIVSGQEDTAGSYTLNLSLAEPGQTTSTEGGVTSYGRVVAGEVSQDNFRQSWTFRGTAGDVVDAMMTVTSGDLDGFLALQQASSGQVIATSDNTDLGQNAALFAVTLPSTDTYTLVARRSGANVGASGTTTGTYELALALRAPANDGDVPVPVQLQLGANMRGLLTADVPTTRYIVEGSGVLSLGLEASDPGQVVTISVIGTDGVLLDVLSGVGTLRSGLTLGRRELLTVEISAPALRDGTPVDFVLNIGQLQVAERSSRALLYDRPQRVDDTSIQPPLAWHFAGQAGDLVDISITPFAPVVGNLEVWGPDGTLLIQRSVRSGFSQPLTVDSDGLYEVILAPEAVDGGYALEVKRTGAAYLAFDQRRSPQIQGTLQPGTAVSLTLEPGGNDAWALNVAEAQSWRFELDQADAASPLALAIETPEGTTLGVAVTDPLTNRAVLQVDLPHPGRYRVLAFDPTGTTANTYTLLGEPVHTGTLALDVPTKGVLTVVRTSDIWPVELLPDGVLSVRVEAVTNSAAPSVFIVGPDGLIIDSAVPGSEPSVTELTGISGRNGGTYQVVVQQLANETRLVYRLTASVETVFADENPVRSVSTTPIPEVFVIADSPTTSNVGSLRVEVAGQITPPVIIEPARVQRAQLGTLIRGEVQTGALYELWAFSPDVNGRVLGFSVVALDDTNGPDIILLDQNGVILAEQFQSGTNAAYLMHRFPTATTYYAAIRLNGSDRYLLYIDTLPDINEEVPEILSGQAIGYGLTRYGELPGQPDDMAQFVFYGHQDDEVAIRLTQQAGGVQPIMALLDVNGNLLAEAGVLEGLELALPGDGIYRLQVTHRADEEPQPGQFAVHLSLTAARLPVERDGGILEDERVTRLTAADTTHRWLFSAQSGESVTLRLEPLSANPANTLRLALADTAGNVFVEREAQFGEGTVQLTDVLLPRSGIYQVIVGEGDRLYRITLERDATYTQDVLGVVRYGETVGKVLTEENYLDVWTFAGSRGDVVSISTRAVRGDQPFVAVQLRDANSQVLATAVDDGSSAGAHVSGITLPSDGHYTIVVGNLDGEFVGQTVYSLTLRLENTSARSMGTVVDYGQTAQGTFFTDDSADTWLFQGKQGDGVTITVAGESSLQAPRVFLVSTDWHISNQAQQANVLAQAEGTETGSATIEAFQLPASGPYAVVVRNTTGESGNYQLTLFADQISVVEAGSIQTGQTRESAIYDGDVSDAWTFSAAKDTLVSITATPGSRSGLVPVVMVLDVEGTVLAQSASRERGAAIDEYRLPYGGTFTIIVTRALGASGFSSGQYSLTLNTALPPDVVTQRIAYDSAPVGSVLNDQTPFERWTFEGEMGDVVTIRATATGGNLDPVIRVYDATGTLLEINDDTDMLSSESTITLPVDGPYEVVVERYGGALGSTSGNYSLLVNRVYRSAPVELDRLLIYGDRVTGSVDSENRSEFWTFAGEQDDTISAKIQYPRDDQPLQLILRDPAGAELIVGTRTVGDVDIDGYALPASGFYTLEVRRPGDAQERYSLYTLEIELEQAVPQTVTQGGTISLNSPAAGRFVAAPASHIWLFQGTAGQDVVVTINRLSGALAVHMELLGPDGAALFTTQAMPGTANAFSTQPVRLPLDGLYTLLVTGDGMALGTVYRLLVQPTLTAAEGVRELTAFQDGFGLIDGTRPRQTWAFEVGAGDVLSLRVAATSGNLVPTLMLWGPDGRPLVEGLVEAGVSGNQAYIARYVATQAGEYRVTVGRQGGIAGSTSGSYHLMLRDCEISSAAASAVDIEFERPATGFLRGSAPQPYAFWGSAGDVVSIAMQSNSEETPPRLALQSESGVAIPVPIIISGSEVRITSFALPRSGRYILLLESDQTVSYALTVYRHAPAFADDTIPGELLLNRGRDGSIDVAGQVDVWSFTGDIGDVYTFELQSVTGGLRASMVLFGPAGFVAGASQPPGVFEVGSGPVRLPESGDYRLVVEPWLGSYGGTGRYTVLRAQAEEGVSGSDGGAILAREVDYTGGLTVNDTTDTWTFEGQSGEVVAIRAAQSQGNELLTLRLLDPENRLLVESAPSSAYRGAEIAAAGLPASGMYTVIASGEPAADSPIEYRLAVVQIQSPLAASVQAAQGIAFGDTRQATLSSSESLQGWVFYGQAGERIQATVTPGTTLFAPALYLVGPGGQVLAADVRLVEGAEAQLVGFVLPDNGFYALVVGSSPVETAWSDATYTVTVQRLAAGAIVQGELVGQEYGQLVLPNPVHQWLLRPAHTGQYAVRARAFAPGARLDLFLVGPDGEVLASGQREETTVTAIAQLESLQRYGVVVSGGAASAQGQYVVEVVPAAYVTGGGTVALGDSDIGRIDSSHFSDEWRIVAQSGTTLIIEVARVSGDLRPTASIRTPDGELVSQEISGDDGVLVLPVDVGSGGLFSVVVSRADDAAGTTSGDYSISVTLSE
ncbi:MAG: hypothetical protein GYB65_13225 [Chloroflexi bacterium]|nr:hypothetical protein [Chloroflexota bacterium]